MALDLWLKEDIRNVLLGIELACAHLATERSDAEAEVFRAGFQAALSAVAVGLGVCSVEQPKTRLSVTRSTFPQLVERGL